MRRRPARADPTPMGNVARLFTWFVLGLVGSLSLLAIALSACTALSGREC